MKCNCLLPASKALCLLYATFFFGLVAAGQAVYPVSGVVRDNDGPVSGISVLIPGTNRGTTTSEQGVYKIEVSRTDTLVFSGTGYKEQRIGVNGVTVVNVLLERKDASLGEVVIIGYGTQSRRNVTGSVSKVNMETTQNLPNTNITQALRGRVAGVQFTDNGRPGQNGTILIRGARSLGADNDPLIVLDGIFFNGSLAEINPNDIESMEILKDASSAAIYGSRAANGVILITSKKGKSEKPVIRLNAFYGISERAYATNLLTPERYLQRILDYRRTAGMPSDPNNITDYLFSSEVENYNAGKTVDNWDLISQQGRIGSYDISVSGNSNRTNYYLSASYVDEQGLYLQDNMKRLTIRSNISNKITDWLTFGFNTSYIRRDYSGLEPDNSGNVSPYATPFYEDGEPTQYLMPETQVNNANPIRRTLLTTNEEIWNNLVANFYSIIELPVKGLQYRINYSPNFRWRHNYNFFRQDLHITANTTSASKFNREDFDWVLENILTYKKQVGRNHRFDLTLLYGLNGSKWESTTASATQLASDLLGWNNLSLGSVFTNSSQAASGKGLSSMFRANYQFKNKYLLTFTVRRDGSSVFAANRKYGTFPSAAIAWIASDEKFLASSKVVDLLKLRVSYGAVGNQAISPYQSLSRSGLDRYVFGDGGTSSLGIFETAMANPDLKWETTYTANAAIDFGLFNNRIGGTVEVYNMNTMDLLVARSLPSMTGFDEVWTNIGQTNNKGIEISLNTVNLKGRDFEWTTNFVFSTNKNKIVHLYNSDTDGDGKEDDDLGNRWFIGQPIRVAYDYTFDGIYQEGDDMPSGYKPGFVRVKDLNGDGLFNDKDRSIIGNTGQPAYRWGITNTFRYKNLSLSVFINAMQGWMSSMSIGTNLSYFHFNRIDIGWWTPENKSNTSPALTYTNPLGHAYYWSRDFIRIQDVSLAYDFDQAFLNRKKIASLRFFVGLKNLHTFTKWAGSDPENGGGYAGFPASRMVTAGFNFGF